VLFGQAIIGAIIKDGSVLEGAMSVAFSKFLWIGAALVLALTGCGKVSKETDAPIAKIGTIKITESQFRDLVKALAGDAEKAKEFLDDEKNRDQRNEFLAKYIESKGMVMLAKNEGMDDDPKIQLQLDDAITMVYYQALVDRRMPKEGPTDAQLREFYREFIAQQGQVGAAFPPFEEAKTHLEPLYKQKQQRDIAQALIKEIKEKFPATFADEYSMQTAGNAIADK
jgi:hypothetical protein